MSITAEHIKSEIEIFLNADVADLETDLFTQGILDSFEAINLIIHLEKKFNKKIQVYDFTSNDQFTINQITTVLNR